MDLVERPRPGMYKANTRLCESFLPYQCNVKIGLTGDQMKDAPSDIVRRGTRLIGDITGAAKSKYKRRDPKRKKKSKLGN